MTVTIVSMVSYKMHLRILDFSLIDHNFNRNDNKKIYSQSRIKNLYISYVHSIIDVLIFSISYECSRSYKILWLISTSICLSQQLILIDDTKINYSHGICVVPVLHVKLYVCTSESSSTSWSLVITKRTKLKNSPPPPFEKIDF